MRSHLDLLICLIENLCLKPIVIALCETWLIDNDPLDIYKLPVYSSNVVLTKTTEKGGGVALFVRNDLNFEDMKYECNIESTTKKNNRPKFKLIISVFYRPPSLSFDNFQDDFEFLLEQHTKSSKKAIVVGNFNLDTLKESRLEKL